MREVTREEFYRWVNPRDICVYCVKTSPIALVEFKTRSGILIGKHTHDYDNEEKKYFFVNDLPNVPEIKD